MTGFEVGQRVWVNRDEKRYPSQGSWPKYRHRKGTVRTLNDDAGEIGVDFANDHRVSWFLPYELVAFD